ncbi:MAG: hypothetical protein JO048_14070 [Methylobacteriaceae bacterium]|nr:hypothetical protein [Methylobacteriaceae bacterium]
MADEAKTREVLDSVDESGVDTAQGRPNDATGRSGGAKPAKAADDAIARATASLGREDGDPDQSGR